MVTPTLKYQVGQEIWHARFVSQEAWVTCPDCAGRGYITCIMGGGDHVTVDCEACKQGWSEFSRGRDNAI